MNCSSGMIAYISVPYFYFVLLVLLSILSLFFIAYWAYLRRKEKKRIPHEKFDKLFYLGDEAQSGTIQFTFILRRDEYVVFKISDLNGDDIDVLLAKNLPKGKHQISWNSKELPNGEYFYVLITYYQKISKRMKIRNAN
jgi:cbb3-type cytochrome oxidase subunit 3